MENQQSYQFRLMWAFNGEQEEHSVGITRSADSVNKAFVLAMLDAVKLTEPRNAHIVELTYIKEA